MNRFAAFNHFTYCPVANYHGELYNLPFNMNTFTKMWPEVKTPEQAQKKIRAQIEAAGIKKPKIWKNRPSLWWERMFTKS